METDPRQPTQTQGPPLPEPLPYATPRTTPSPVRMDRRMMFAIGLGVLSLGLGWVLADRETLGAVVMGVGGFMTGYACPPGRGETD